MRWALAALVALASCAAAPLIALRPATAPFEWTQRLSQGDRPREESGMVIALESSGDVVVAGRTRGALGEPSLLLARYSAGGELRWVQTSDVAEEADGILAVAIVAGGEIVVAGRRQGKAFLARHSATGAQLWQKALDAEPIVAMAIDPTGTIAACAGGSILRFAGDGSPLDRAAFTNGEGRPLAIVADRGGGLVVAGAQEASGSRKVAVARLDANLKLLWKVTFGGELLGGRAEIAQAAGVSLAPDGEIVLAVANSAGSPGSERAIVVKLEGNGVLKWFAALEGEQLWPKSVAVDPRGNIFVVGSVFALPGEQNRGKSDLFVAALLPGGSPSSAIQFGTPEADAARAVAANAHGVFVVSDLECKGEAPATCDLGIHKL